MRSRTIGAEGLTTHGHCFRMTACEELDDRGRAEKEVPVDIAGRWEFEHETAAVDVAVAHDLGVAEEVDGAVADAVDAAAMAHSQRAEDGMAVVVAAAAAVVAGVVAEVAAGSEDENGGGVAVVEDEGCIAAAAAAGNEAVEVGTDDARGSVEDARP